MDLEANTLVGEVLDILVNQTSQGFKIVEATLWLDAENIVLNKIQILSGTKLSSMSPFCPCVELVYGAKTNNVLFNISLILLVQKEQFKR